MHRGNTMLDYEQMTNSQLRVYIPDVYQKNVYHIDYARLARAGVKLISFDVDDTIAMAEEAIPPEETIRLFQMLKRMGFMLVLMSNNKSHMRADIFSSQLQVDYIMNAGKPTSEPFKGCQNLYYLRHLTKLRPIEMAHVGNNLINDIGGGNAFGTVTCLVRRMGNIPKLVPHESRIVRMVLESRGLFRKHHLYQHHDQYYQLGELPPYLK